MEVPNKMPKLQIENIGEFTVRKGTRLILAITDNNGDINHACGGNARCTTCRIEFITGEPSKYTQAEYDKLSETQSLGKYRLSCQCTIEEDMSIRVLDKFSTSGRPDPGSLPNDDINPTPNWIYPTSTK